MIDDIVTYTIAISGWCKAQLLMSFVGREYVVINMEKELKVNFLKKLGTILKIVGQVSGFIPLLNQQVPETKSTTVNTVIDKLTQAMNVIVTVEQTLVASGAQVTGANKLAAATPFIAQLIQQSDLLIGKHPKDEAKFQQSVTALTSNLADILSSFE